MLLSDSYSYSRTMTLAPMEKVGVMTGTNLLVCVSGPA
jgi:hypothetical protein